MKVLKALRSHPAGTNRNGSIGEHPSSQPGRESSQPTSRTTRGTVTTNGQPPTNDLRLANGRPSEAVPRDAKAKKETTSEIANFIRSTGPETLRPVPPNNMKAENETVRSTPTKSGNLKTTKRTDQSAQGNQTAADAATEGCRYRISEEAWAETSGSRRNCLSRRTNIRSD